MTDVDLQLENSVGRKLLADFLTEKVKKTETLKIFDDLTRIYLEVNSIINISAIRNVDDIYVKHYLDSIYPHERFIGHVCDVGCGGGFPSLPLAIVTDCFVTGIDGVGKKLLLINRCISELGLKNIKADYARSEDLVKLHRSYDTVCARAVADVEKTLSYCSPLCKSGGHIVLYRTQSDSPAKENTLQKYSLSLKECEDYVLPGTDIKRRLLVYEKHI